MIANMVSRRSIPPLAAALTALLVAASARGALPEQPAANLDPPYGDWLIYLVMIVLLLAVASAAFKSAKRSHLD